MSSRLKGMIKVTIVCLVSTAFTIVLLEISAFLAYPYLFDKPFSRSDIRKNLLQNVEKIGADGVLEPFKNPFFVSETVIHPYLGFVQDPETAEIARLGFWQNPQEMKRSPDRVIIGITGGSVALSLFLNAGDALKQQLAATPAFAGKEIRLFCFALGGFKQPQQLFVLNYMLLLGAEFDEWINLDGYNELNESVNENWRQGIAPIYPRQWKLYARKTFDRNTLRIMVEVQNNERQRSAIRRFFSRTPLLSSVFCLTVWERLDRMKNHRGVELQLKLEAMLASAEKSLQVTGPISSSDDWREILTESVRIWRQSSLTSDAVCRSSGIRYHHFLQPNQYARQAKVFSDTELKTAFYPEGNLFRDVAEAGYPVLSQAGASLLKDGVRFHDLSQLYRGMTDTLFVDACCHINKQGNLILASAIAEAVGQRSEVKGQRSETK
jgi:hypothetical protein